MSFYVYCLSEEAAPLALEDVTGIRGAMVCVMSFGSIQAVVSKQDERVGVTRENVIAHQAVINRALAQTTPVPCRFGTAVTAEELEKYIDSNKAKLEALFERVRGSVEMNIKVIWDKEEIRRAATGVSTASGIENLSPGRAFLMARQREIAGDETLKRSSEDIARWLKESFSGITRETSIAVRPAEAMVIKAAFLVEHSRIDLYRERVRLLREQRSDLRFMMSGPWPPYSFAEID